MAEPTRPVASGTDEAGTTGLVAGRMTRRRVLQAGGLTVALGAFAAACGKSEEGAPGRVGYAPAATALPTEIVDDPVYLRTANSIEVMLVQVYEEIRETGVLDATATTLLDRLIEDHAAASATVAGLTEDAGGEPYECANAWYLDRVIDPFLANILGDEALDIPPSNEPARDMMTLINGLESMTGAMYQQQVELLNDADLRAAVMVLGAEAARHAGAVAILVMGAPEGYADPSLFGEEVALDPAALTPLYAVPTQFGSLAAIPVAVGVPSSAGTRYTANLETPSDNSFIYTGMTCDV
ncbi:MAG: hypothetical protein ABW328_16310 [Ilumatobacteraceae bacterium]